MEVWGLGQYVTRGQVLVALLLSFVSVFLLVARAGSEEPGLDWQGLSHQCRAAMELLVSSV